MMGAYFPRDCLSENAVSVTALLLAQSETASDTVGSISENTLGDIGLAIIGIIASLVAGYFATSALKHRNFDSLFVPPWKPLFQTESQQQPWPISTWLGRAIAATGMLFVFTFLQHRPVAETSSRRTTLRHHMSPRVAGLAVPSSHQSDGMADGRPGGSHDGRPFLPKTHGS